MGGRLDQIKLPSLLEPGILPFLIDTGHQSVLTYDIIKCEHKYERILFLRVCVPLTQPRQRKCAKGEQEPAPASLQS